MKNQSCNLSLIYNFGSQGIIQPHSVMDVPLVITPQGLEELEIVAQLMIFGSPDPPLVSKFSGDLHEVDPAYCKKCFGILQ